ncbi:hypothetical protein EBU24_04870 [bacterium]|nr:hypothetical protein [bacterium]
MSTESIATSNQSDADQVITIRMKASDAKKIRNIAACLASPLDESRIALLKVCNATPEDMMQIHHQIYQSENS